MVDLSRLNQCLVDYDWDVYGEYCRWHKLHYTGRSHILPSCNLALSTGICLLCKISGGHEKHYLSTSGPVLQRGIYYIVEANLPTLFL